MRAKRLVAYLLILILIVMGLATARHLYLGDVFAGEVDPVQSWVIDIEPTPVEWLEFKARVKAFDDELMLTIASMKGTDRDSWAAHVGHLLAVTLNERSEVMVLSFGPECMGGEDYEDKIVTKYLKYLDGAAMLFAGHYYNTTGGLGENVEAVKIDPLDQWASMMEGIFTSKFNITERACTP